MKDVHVSTLHKLFEMLKETGHTLATETEEIPSLKVFWDKMYEEIPSLLTDLEEILSEAGEVTIEAGEEALEVGEVVAAEAGEVLLK